MRRCAAGKYCSYCGIPAREERTNKFNRLMDQELNEALCEQLSDEYFYGYLGDEYMKRDDDDPYQRAMKDDY